MDFIGTSDKLWQDVRLMEDTPIGRWLSAMDLYDPDAVAHTLRVTALSLRLARGLGFRRSVLQHLQYGTLFHDIGKLGVPGWIMQKPGTLTTYEYQRVKQHPVHAYEWLLGLNAPKPAMVIPLYHHEWWDGSGYPYGLQGKAIPVLARIVAVVDVWDALTSDRPYRKAMTTEQALDIIRAETGTHFDPAIVAAFFDLGIPETPRVLFDKPFEVPGMG